MRVIYIYCNCTCYIAERKLLAQAEEFHLIALSMTMKVYGEKNLQTAKHYGNLGRLCQSMKKFKEAEQMHIKAISIKEELLGPDHLEVGLSVGHLASLYNYHMGEYHKAKDLYMRSISISKCWLFKFTSRQRLLFIAA